MTDIFSTGTAGRETQGYFGIESHAANATVGVPPAIVAIPTTGDEVQHLSNRGNAVLQSATSQHLGIIRTAQIKRAAADEIKTYVVERVRTDAAAALEIVRANASTAVTLHKEGLALWRAEITNGRRIDLDAKLAAIGQGVLEQSFRQLDRAFESLEAEEALIIARYPQGSSRREQRLGLVQEQAQRWVLTIRGKVQLIMDKACHEFQDALKI